MRVAAIAAAAAAPAAAYEHTFSDFPASGLHTHCFTGKDSGCAKRYHVPGVNLSWTLDRAAGHLDVELALPIPANESGEVGWIAVGWQNDKTHGGEMQNSDLVFGYSPSGGGAACIRSQAFVYNMQAGPNSPGSFNVTNGVFSVVGNVARLGFRRPLTCGKPHTQNVVRTDGPQYVMVAAASAKPHPCFGSGAPASCGGAPDDCAKIMSPDAGITHVHDLINDAACIDFSTGEYFENDFSGQDTGQALQPL